MTGAGIPLREFFSRLGFTVHDMVIDGKVVPVDEMRVYGFTPARADGSPDESAFVPAPSMASVGEEQG